MRVVSPVDNRDIVTRLTLFLLVACCAAAQELPNGLYAIFHTSAGKITARLYEKETPITVREFRRTGARKEGDSQCQDRQTGDGAAVRQHHVSPRGAGRDDPVGRPHRARARTTAASRFAMSICRAYGSIAAAGSRWQTPATRIRAAASSSSRPMPCAAWNGKYTIFGVVVEGQDVVERINRGPVHDDRPVQPVKLLTVTIERVGPEPVKKGKK